MITDHTKLYINMIGIKSLIRLWRDVCAFMTFWLSTSTRASRSGPYSQLMRASMTFNSP